MIDLLKISSETDLYNFHSHTQYCDGRVPMETMLRTAIDEGFLHWGFSPHSPIPIDSPCNMKRVDVEQYLNEIARLRETYGDRIKIYAGMEIDYLSSEWGPHVEYFRELPLDYRIGSVHFIPGGENFVDVDGSPESFMKKMERYFDNDIRHVVNAYYDSLCAMIQSGGFDIVGHLDKIGHNASCFSPGIEDQPWYQKRVNEAIDLVIEKRLIAELNTKAWHTASRIFPKECFIPRLVAAGTPIVVSSDAHYPDRVNAGRREGLALLNAIKSARPSSTSSQL
ncbi:MAG: histidinol-phosphatase [Bacteroides sp.]|nr:histidinol-phosphatase [Bacteroides sp.]